MSAILATIDGCRVAMAPICSLSENLAPDALLDLGRQLRDTGYRFSAVSPSTLRRVNARMGNDWAVTPSEIFGWGRRFRQTALPPMLFSLMRRAGVLLAGRDGLRSAVRLVMVGRQLYFHAAEPSAAAGAPLVGPDLQRYARALATELPELSALTGRVRRVVELGCGAGVGAITLAVAMPRADVLAVDSSEEALTLTQVNARLACANNVSVCNSDLLHDVDGQFDLIVANAAWLRERSQLSNYLGASKFGVTLALSIIQTALARLAPGGTLLLQAGVPIVNDHDPLLTFATAQLSRAGYDWSYEELDPDIGDSEANQPASQGADRVAAVWLKATRPATIGYIGQYPGNFRRQFDVH
ncbi:methyltransferase [Oxalobacteraceae bacterium]|nr:methyltransferase [Oxalobacteraceae bacterium]